MSQDYSDDILDGLEGDAAPAKPKPSPPASTTHVAHARWVGILELAAVAVASMALAVGVTAWWLGGRDSAPPSHALTVVARDYVRTLPDTYFAVEGGVRRRELKTKSEVVAALKAHARPLADAQDAAIKVNDKGELTDPDGLADNLHRVGVGLRGGR